MFHYLCGMRYNKPTIDEQIKANQFLKNWMNIHGREITIKKLTMTEELKSTNIQFADFTKIYGVYSHGGNPFMFICSGHETYPVSRVEWIPVYPNQQMNACYGKTIVEACEVGLRDAIFYL